MKTYLDCFPCFCRQTLEAVRFVTDDPAVHEDTLRRVLKAASEMNLRSTPPEMGRYIHHLIRDLTGNGDPYKKVKAEYNAAALALYPGLKRKVAAAPDRLEAAVRLAIAGNIIDYGATPGLEQSSAWQVIDEALTKPLFGCGVAAFREAVERAGRILYLGDNAGEIVFDRLLVEELDPAKTTFVVREVPIINDATMADAEAAGLTGIVRVISNGGDAPGTLLDECSPEFREEFSRADVVISKGQGNYETLSDVPRRIFFLLMAKCEMIARDIGCERGSMVLVEGKR